jgi:hypothetical protein
LSAFAAGSNVAALTGGCIWTCSGALLRVVMRDFARFDWISRQPPLIEGVVRCGHRLAAKQNLKKIERVEVAARRPANRR